MSKILIHKFSEIRFLNNDKTYKNLKCKTLLYYEKKHRNR